MKNAILSAAKIFLSTVLMGAVIRLMFFILHFSRGGEMTFRDILSSFSHGLSLDVTVAGYITAPVMLFLLIINFSQLGSPQLWRKIMMGYLVFAATLMSMVVGIDLNLYRYWLYRVDGTLLPYLTDASELGSTLGTSDILIGFGSTIICLFCFITLYRLSMRSFDFKPQNIAWRVGVGSFLLLASGFVFLAIRGGMSESVANVSRVYFSVNQFLNHAAVNPIFSLFSSIGEGERYSEFYPFFEEEQLVQHFEQMQPKDKMSHFPMLKTTRPDVLFIIAESYPQAIVDSLVAGREVMPNMRRLSREGMVFENYYASGGRTDRGVTALLSGFPAQPKVSIMKIPAKSRHLPSIASSLGANGYESAFYYGGDLDFMDMGSYLLSTGWAEISDVADIKTQEPQRAWGYSDGAMVDVLSEEFISRTQRNAPQLLAWLTLSSHEPFDVPADMGFDDKILNALAYSDAQVGRLVNELRRSTAWDNLLIVISADHTLTYSHNVKYNAPKHYHIPMIWTGGAIATPQITVDASCSQTDVAASILAQLNIPNHDFIFAKNIFNTNTNDPRYAYYAFSDGFGVINENNATIYDNISKTITQATNNGADIKPLKQPLDSINKQQLNIGKTILQMSHLVVERY